MSLKVNIYAKLRCPKHRYYSPERDGLAFRANCHTCAALHSAYSKSALLVDAIKHAEEMGAARPKARAKKESVAA